MRITDVIAGFSALLWVGVMVSIVIITLQASRGQKVKNGRAIIITVLAAALVVTTLSSGLVFIDPEERGVVISALAPKGYREQALQPGLRWIVPFVERVVKYPISRQTYTMSIVNAEGQVQGDDSITARTANGQEIFVDASVIYQVDPEKVVRVHILWQDRYPAELIRAQSRGIIRDAVSQYGVEEVVTDKRFELVKYINDKMTEKLSENGLILVDFVLRNITFSPEYAASVEQKQISEQQVQQAVFIVQQRKQEALQVIETAKGQADSAVIAAEGAAKARLIQAQAEADSLKLIQDAIANNPELLTYQYISKLAPNINTMLLPSNAPCVFTIPGVTP
ncbi:MAG: prohibitin family protein [Anaerolineaceae bacterium]|nr:prohibitin family protein [Anaerolineaceae bacterium]